MRSSRVVPVEELPKCFAAVSACASMSTSLEVDALTPSGTRFVDPFMRIPMDPEFAMHRGFSYKQTPVRRRISENGA